MNKFVGIFKVIFFVVVISFRSNAQNPVIQTIYTADPAPMVYNDTVYLYTGHDEDNSTWFTMNEWRVYSSADMVNWTDLGSPLKYQTFNWASGDAWAGQCIPRNGKFYYYVPMTQKTGGMAVGVAVSNSPSGPFTDPLGHPLVSTGTGDIDPTVYIDNDGQAYLYWGNPNLFYVKLNEDMISYSGSIVQVNLTTAGFGVRSDTDRPTSYEEGPWFYKRNNLYYMLFAAGPIPEHIAYSTSTSPLGPWTYQGVIMPAQGGSFTNHCGIIDYKGNSYFFYHNGALPGGGGFTRSVCIEQFDYNADGSIPTINMTAAGIVNPVSNLNPFIRNEAETIAWESGIETEKLSNGGGVDVYSIGNNDYIKIRSVDFGDNGAGAFTASISSATIGGSIELRLNSRIGSLIGTLPVNYTAGWDNWREETTNISGAAGVNDLYLVFKGSPGVNLFKIDYWKFEPKSETHDLLGINASVDNYKIDTVSGSNTTTLKVLAVYGDGTSEDITSVAQIIPQQDGIVNVSNGIITGITYGPAAINISYEGKTDLVNILVKDLKTEITAKALNLDKYTIDLLTGSTADVMVTVEYEDGHTEDVTAKASYINSNNSVAAISAGKITAKSEGTTIITISFEDPLGNTVSAQLTINVSSRSPYDRNEAEDYNAQNGIQTEDCSDTGGGLNVGYIENGDWLRYNSLDFGSGAASFQARIASATSGGNLEIRLDSPTGSLAGTCVVSGSGGWQTWITKSCTVSGLSGIHDIYLKFTGGSGYLFNINWWKFNPEISDVEQESSLQGKPESFFLEQNYPNPFNPSTFINYQLPEGTFVILKVFDLLGREIKTLVNEYQDSGKYSVQFSAVNLSSGLYLYKLDAGPYHDIKKLLVLK
ncbi:MAG TPA: carbohydrate-binding protein [Ignavibacteriaceae bacterium]|nr:carbohydrate-binding protein [Ignavibacteriaceae bacterium]